MDLTYFFVCYFASGFVVDEEGHIAWSNGSCTSGCCGLKKELGDRKIVGDFWKNSGGTEFRHDVG